MANPFNGHTAQSIPLLSVPVSRRSIVLSLSAAAFIFRPFPKLGAIALIKGYFSLKERLLFNVLRVIFYKKLVS